MTDAAQLTPAKPDDIAEAIAFALRYSGRTRVNDAGEMMRLASSPSRSWRHWSAPGSSSCSARRWPVARRSCSAREHPKATR
jgi:hypothetical protein